MTRRRVSARTVDRLQDRVYRQMFRLEADPSGADLPLAMALLDSWIALEELPPESEPRLWLRRICPLCVRMIQRASGCVP